MNHFSLAEWADYVREVVSADQRARMRKHLDGGCGRCTSTVGMWTSISDFAKREVSYEPPANTLRIAESFLAPIKLASQGRRDIRLVPLTFDSVSQQTPLGARGFDAVPRQLMYQLGDVFIDMRLEPKPASNLVTLAGQIVDSSQPTVSLKEVPLSLVKGEETLLETTTNQLGEFQFSFPSADHLMLLVEIRGTSLLMLLPNVGDEV